MRPVAFLIDALSSIYTIDHRRYALGTGRARFDQITGSDTLPSAAELGTPLLEPHASWMTRIEAEWQKRYTR